MGVNGVEEPLSRARISILASADRAQIASGVSQLNLGAGGEWFPGGNVYVPKAHNRLVADGKAVPSPQSPAFVQYLGASAFVHCGDAWGYLGRALGALLQGDLHSSVHLTYYAELRSAISLLASEGIYIGNGLNLAIDAAGGVHEISRDQTHRAAWKCLAAWSDLARSSDLIGRLLKPGGSTLQSWADSLSGSGVGPVVNDLLGRMALDLQSFVMDRQRRNDASYDPSRLVIDDLGARSSQTVVSQIWQSLEPDASGTFPVMDAILLQDILSSAYKSTHINESDGSTDWSRWQDWLSGIVPAKNVGSALELSLQEVPTGGAAKSVLGAAFDDTSSAFLAQEFIAAMLSRTTVLLRLSTGSCLDLLDSAGLSAASLEPWVESLSLARGIWSVGDVPESKLDLWADVDVARQELEEADAADYRTLLQTVGSYGAMLAQAERVVAWSFGS